MWKRISSLVNCTPLIGDCWSMLEPALPVMFPQSPVRTITALSRVDLPSGVTMRNEPNQVPEKAEQETSLVCADKAVAVTSRQSAPSIHIFISIWISTECSWNMFRISEQFHENRLVATGG